MVAHPFVIVVETIAVEVLAVVEDGLFRFGVSRCVEIIVLVVWRCGLSVTVLVGVVCLISVRAPSYVPLDLFGGGKRVVWGGSTGFVVVWGSTVWD